MKRTLVVVPGHDLDGAGCVADEGTTGDDAGQSAARLTEAVFRDTVAFAETLHFGPGTVPPELVMAYTGDRSWYAQRTSAHWLLVPRMGASLAQCLDNALIVLGAGPDDETIFLGGATPHVPTQALREAYVALGQRQVVVGPAEADGVCLVGVRGRWPCGILGDVRWTTKHATPDLLRAFRRARLSVGLLAPFYHLQTYAHLRRLSEDFGVYPDRALGNIRCLLERLGESQAEEAEGEIA